MRANSLRKLSFDKILAQPPANDVRDELPTEDEEHLEMVRRIAGALVRQLPSHVDKDELVSLGYMGLVEARRRFDPSRGVPFGAFAVLRVRGAMIDWLRQLDPLSRDERARLRTSDETASVTLVDFSYAEDHVASGGNAVEELLHHERRVLMGRALDKLSARERLVVTRHFFEERTLKQIGAELKVTEARVCQIVGAVVARLRTMVTEASMDEAA